MQDHGTVLRGEVWTYFAEEWSKGKSLCGMDGGMRTKLVDCRECGDESR